MRGQRGASGWLFPTRARFSPECTAGQTACPEQRSARVRKIHVQSAEGTQGAIGIQGGLGAQAGEGGDDGIGGGGLQRR